jgi:hypothetical protein
VPNAHAVNMAAHTLEVIAQLDGPCRLVHVRVAPDGGGGVYIDLGNATWRAIHITPGAWQAVEQPNVMFLRSPGMRPLPEPVRGGTLETLRGLMNLP